MALALAVFMSCPLWAQENPGITDSLGLYGGRFLPEGIYGVRDLYPYWGARYGHKIWGIDPELSSFFVDALGVNLTDVALSIAFPFDYEGISYRPFIGGDLYYYRGHTNLRELPYSTTSGFHMGLSPVLKVTDRLAIRVDFKLNFGPGVSLMVDGGLETYF